MINKVERLRGTTATHIDRKDTLVYGRHFLHAMAVNGYSDAEACELAWITKDELAEIRQDPDVYYRFPMFSARLENILARIGMGRRDMADYCNVTMNTIKKIFNGYTFPTFDVIGRIHNLMRMDEWKPEPKVKPEPKEEPKPEAPETTEAPDGQIQFAGCDYCDAVTPFVWLDPGNRASMMFDPENARLVVGSRFGKKDVKIAFCPFCGGALS